MAKMRWDHEKGRHVMIDAASDARVGAAMPKRNAAPRSAWDPKPIGSGHAQGGKVRRLSRAEIEAMKTTPAEMQAAIDKAAGEEIYMRMKLLPSWKKPDA